MSGTIGGEVSSRYGSLELEFAQWQLTTPAYHPEVDLRSDVVRRMGHVLCLLRDKDDTFTGLIIKGIHYSGSSVKVKYLHECITRHVAGFEFCSTRGYSHGHAAFLATE